MLPPRPTAVVEMLYIEHEEVRTLFVLYAMMRHPQTRRMIVTHVSDMLERHIQLETLVFYPAFAAVTDPSGSQLIALRLQEHQQGATFLRELRAFNAEDTGFDAAFHTLIEHMEDLMGAEEHEIFPLATEHLAAQDESILRAIEEFRAQAP